SFASCARSLRGGRSTAALLPSAAVHTLALPLDVVRQGPGRNRLETAVHELHLAHAVRAKVSKVAPQLTPRRERPNLPPEVQTERLDAASRSRARAVFVSKFDHPSFVDGRAQRSQILRRHAAAAER